VSEYVRVWCVRVVCSVCERVCVCVVETYISIFAVCACVFVWICVCEYVVRECARKLP